MLEGPALCRSVVSHPECDTAGEPFYLARLLGAKAAKRDVRVFAVFFPFSGWKESFFDDMHAQGRDAIEFYTEKKVVVERWPKEWCLLSEETRLEI